MRRFVPVTLLSPVLFSTLGIDGGAIFQIVAIENLGLSPTAIGFAFGLGVLSLPVQFLAARIPLSRARHNLQLFLAVSSALVLWLAIAVHRGRGGAFASVALGVTVMAEVAVSVLFATSWQPLLSHSLVSVDRQRLNTQIRSAGVVIAVVALVIFSALSPTGRVVFLIGVATLAPWAAYGLRPKHTIEPAPPPRDVVTGGAAVKRRIPADLRRILVAFGAIGFASWPLVLVYVRSNLWPTANLGVVGAFQLVGSLAVSFLWRPTAEPVAHRAWVMGGVLVACAVVLSTFASPLDSRATKVCLLVVVAIASGATTGVRIVLLELFHRSTNDTTSVSAFTMLDIVASTSLQLGLLGGGVLISASSSTLNWLVDPYRIYIVGVAVLALIAIGRVRTPIAHGHD